MITEIILAGVSCLIISLYLTAYISNRGLPESLSDTYYYTTKKWIFPTVTATAGATALIPLMEVTPDSYRFVAFFIVAAIMFVAASPTFKDEMVGRVHAVAAIILGVAALVWIILTIGMPWLAAILTIAGVFDRKRFLFWFETGLLYNLYWGLFTAIAMNG